MLFLNGTKVFLQREDWEQLLEHLLHETNQRKLSPLNKKTMMTRLARNCIKYVFIAGCSKKSNLNKCKIISY